MLNSEMPARINFRSSQGNDLIGSSHSQLDVCTSRRRRAIRIFPFTADDSGSIGYHYREAIYLFTGYQADSPGLLYSVALGLKDQKVFDQSGIVRTYGINTGSPWLQASQMKAAIRVYRGGKPVGKGSCR